MNLAGPTACTCLKAEALPTVNELSQSLSHNEIINTAAVRKYIL